MLVWIPTSDVAGETSRALADLSQLLIEAGLPLAGTVQRELPGRPDCACDMELHFPGHPQPPIRISQSLGAGSRGCRLDPGALEQAVAVVERQLAAAPRLLIVNRFGKQESYGRGFRDTIATALAQEIPVLTSVPPDNRAAFLDFAGDFATRLDSHQARDWALSLVPADEIDALDLICPLPVLRLRKRLQDLPAGATVRLLASDPAAVIDVPHFCAEGGHNLLATTRRAIGHAFLIRKIA